MKLFVLMYTNELEYLGQKHVKHFVGVFPLDKIPSHICPTSRLIINTDTHNLGGKHWIALSFEKGGIVLAFDPLGFFYPQILINKLYNNPMVKRVHFNRKMIQMPWEKTCGQHCIKFLKSLSINNN